MWFQWNSRKTEIAGKIAKCMGKNLKLKYFCYFEILLNKSGYFWNPCEKCYKPNIFSINFQNFQNFEGFKLTETYPCILWSGFFAIWWISMEIENFDKI